MSEKGNDKLPALNERQTKIASYFEQMFWTNGTLATDEKVADDLKEDVKYIKKLWDNSTFRTYLVTRGVNLSREFDHVLTPQQLLLANVLLNAHDTQTIREKLKLVNVSSQQYHAWMRQGAFREYMEKRAKEMFAGRDWEMYQSLSDAAANQDTSALKLYFEMRGIYSPRLDVNVNLDSVMAQVIEVISKHTSMDVMQAIAADIQKVLDGEPVDMRPAVAQKAIPAISREIQI